MKTDIDMYKLAINNIISWSSNYVYAIWHDKGDNSSLTYMSKVDNSCLHW